MPESRGGTLALIPAVKVKKDKAIMQKIGTNWKIFLVNLFIINKNTTKKKEKEKKTYDCTKNKQKSLVFP